jgi:hypothetical protein
MLLSSQFLQRTGGGSLFEVVRGVSDRFLQCSQSYLLFIHFMQIAAVDALFKCLAQFISSHLRSAQPQRVLSPLVSALT